MSGLNVDLNVAPAELDQLRAVLSQVYACFSLAGMPPMRLAVNLDWRVQWSAENVALLWHVHLDARLRRIVYNKANFLPSALRELASDSFASLALFESRLNQVQLELLALETET